MVWILWTMFIITAEDGAQVMDIRVKRYSTKQKCLKQARSKRQEGAHYAMCHVQRTKK